MENPTDSITSGVSNMQVQNSELSKSALKKQQKAAEKDARKAETQARLVSQSTFNLF